MFWSLELPITITFWTLVVGVLACTALAPVLKCSRGLALLVSATVAIFAFVPLCLGVMVVVDAFRFGDFEYATFADVDDFRVEQYLPTAAKRIKMRTFSNGYRAQYEITTAEFDSYLNELWDKYGAYSATPRGSTSGENKITPAVELAGIFSDLGWQPLPGAMKYCSPTEDDGGGATYYYDRSLGIAYQRTGYW